MDILEGDKLIAEFAGYKLIKNCIQTTDLYECGDKMGEDITEDIWVLNPTDKFLEIKRFGTYSDVDYYNDTKPYDDWHYERGLQYHSSWDRLMLVVEKIELLGYDSRIMGNNSDGGFLCDFVNINNIEISCKTSFSSKLEAVWLAVIEFIEWYNKQKESN